MREPVTTTPARPPRSAAPFVLAVLLALAVPVAALAVWLDHRLGGPPGAVVRPSPQATATAPLRGPIPLRHPEVNLVYPSSPPPFSPVAVTSGGDLAWYSLPGDASATATRVRALGWDGRFAGALDLGSPGPSPEEALRQSPDGRLFLFRGLVLDASGATVATLRTGPSGFVAWADDSRHVCRLGFPGDPRGRVGLGVVAVGDAGWRIVTTLPAQSDGGNPWAIAACSPAHDRVVLSAADPATAPLRRLEVRSLRSGALLHAVDYDTRPLPCAGCRAADTVHASLDAGTVVECVYQAGCEVRRLDADSEVRRLPAALGMAVGVSADGSLLAFPDAVVAAASGAVVTRPPAQREVIDVVAHPGTGDLCLVLLPTVSGPYVVSFEMVRTDGSAFMAPR